MYFTGIKYNSTIHPSKQNNPAKETEMNQAEYIIKKAQKIKRFDEILMAIAKEGGRIFTVDKGQRPQYLSYKFLDGSKLKLSTADDNKITLI